MTERESVIVYLEGRIEKAWIEGNFEEGSDCNNFLNALEIMSEEEYDAHYADVVDLGQIA